MDELLEQFLIEGRDLVSQAHADLAVLSRQPNDISALGHAFRAIHTLKGSIAIFGISPAENLLHAAEELMASARRDGVLAEDRTSALVTVIDQVDRWIDQLEAKGELAFDAPALAEALIAGLSSGLSSNNVHVPIGSAEAQPPWATELAARCANVIGGEAGPLTLFRIVPDRDCFFRGEDPLAMAMAVPHLLSLDLVPASDVWPSPSLFEPFVCVSKIEAISAADAATVQKALRLTAGKVDVYTLPSEAHQEQAATTGKEEEFIRVPVARVDALADGTGELMVAINAAAAFAARLDSLDRTLGAEMKVIQTKLDKVAGRLQREVSAVRSVPLTLALRRLPRLGREIAQNLGKEIDFVITGDDLEVDKRIADALFEPLLHLLRNAIDHGAEPAQGRAEAGKPPKCQIKLEFHRIGDMVDVLFTDDGRGMDAAVIRSLARERGIMPNSDIDALSDAQALRLIFLPGFSTAAQVSQISGRGVGMDAVHAAIERLRGSIDIESRPLVGTQFRMRLPVHALTTRLLIVEAGTERYGVPLDQIIETARIAQGDLKSVGSGRACVLRGRTVPVLELGVLFGGAPSIDAIAKLVIILADGEPVAVRVDNFAGRLDAFVRPAKGMLTAFPAMTGSTLLGDGHLLLVLDLAELVA